MVAVDLSELKMERHVRLALGRALELSRSEPLTAATVLQAAVDVGGSQAFGSVSKLLPELPAARDVQPAGTSAPPDFSMLDVDHALARSFEIARPHLATGERAVWGRDLITIAVLTQGDTTLAELATAGGTDLDTLRASWLEFVRGSALHRPADEWTRWWQDAGLLLPATSPTESEIAVSASVQGVAKQFADESTVTGVSTFDIARAMAASHLHYAGKRLSPDDLATPDDAKREEWDVWIASIAQLLDPGRLAGSRHQVLDGRLLIVGLGLIDSALRQRLERRDLWGALLLEIDETVAKPGSALDAALRTVKLRHGYSNDDAGGDDQLGIKGEVRALCEVLLDPDVTPPLAVGLFGKWGSGKSFFMESMRQQIAELSRGARPSDDRNVVQIRFNAWHYADSNLWASLASEIFERLADPEPPTPAAREEWLLRHGDPNRERREQLLTNLESYRSLKDDLDEKVGQLESQKEQLCERHEDLVRDREQMADSYALTNVATELAADPRIQSALTEIVKVLGVRAAVQELTALASELRTTSGYLLAVWRKTERKSLVVGLFVFSLIVVFGALAIGTRQATAISALVSVASVLAAVRRGLLPAARGVKVGLECVTHAAQTAAYVEAELTAQRFKEESLLASELRQLEQEIVDNSREQRVLDQRIASAEAEARSLDIGRQLLDFLTNRATGYQQQQGVVGMLHRDFRQLDAYVRLGLKQATTAVQATAAIGDAAEHGQVAEQRAWLRAIDRVVLYIDDLDRCPPDKVLEVLEAVHLLLALPLFVVVVGVDPRWLERSLRHQYKHLALQDPPGDDVYLQLMPLEYLEKIFQLPLTLPAMETGGEEGGFRRLVQSLAPMARPTSSEATPGKPAPTRRPSAAEQPAARRTPARVLIEVQEGSAASGEGGTALDLTTPEVEFAQRLGPLVTTPRAAKRLLNTYRFIRATQHVGSRSRFLGSDGGPGEYPALLTLLAVAAGYPSLADPFLVALEQTADMDAVSTWPDFLAELDPETPGALVPAWLKEAADRPITQAAVAGWADLHERLGAIQPGAANDGKPDLSAYRRWGPIAARFSFKL
jgi:uncharacterized membrane protein (UPF0136 family)